MKKRRTNWKQYITDNKTECLYWNYIFENESTEGQNDNYVESIFFPSFFVYADKNYVSAFKITINQRSLAIATASVIVEKVRRKVNLTT